MAHRILFPSVNLGFSRFPFKNWDTSPPPVKNLEDFFNHVLVILIAVLEILLQCDSTFFSVSIEK